MTGADRSSEDSLSEDIPKIALEAETIDIPDPTAVRADEISAVRQELVNYRILRSLRQIIQAVDLHSRHLTQVYSITGPQLVCLLSIAEKDHVTLSELAQDVYLSPSTVVGIVDRLEREGFVHRERSTTDRRVVLIKITAKGKDFVAKAPSPIQDQLESRLEHLPSEEQRQIAESLEKIAELMGAERIDAAPLLQSGDISASADA